MCIFLDDEDYRQFVHVLGDVVEGFAIRCWNYCLMPNHYHATLQPTLANFSEAIRRLNSVYAQWWNMRHGRVGHVFQGRFKDQIVDEDAYILTLSRYVVMNPVRAGLARKPEDWPWGSYRGTVGLSPVPAFLSTTQTLRLFGEGSDTILQARFASFVTEPQYDSASFDRIRSKERILGPRAFKELVRASTRFRSDEGEFARIQE